MYKELGCILRASTVVNKSLPPYGNDLFVLSLQTTHAAVTQTEASMPRRLLLQLKMMCLCFNTAYHCHVKCPLLVTGLMIRVTLQPLSGLAEPLGCSGGQSGSNTGQ